MRRAVVAHPFLFATFPVLSLLAANFHLVRPGLRIGEAAASHVLLAGLGLLALRALFRDWHKAGLLASAWALALIPLRMDPEWLLEQPVLAGGAGRTGQAWWCIVALAATVLVLRARGDLRRWTAVANAAAVLVVAMPGLRIASWQMARWRRPAPRPAAAAQPRRRPIAASGPRPDIYYIILDRYASADTLAESFGFDNGDAIRYLQAKGFYVASRSCANYPKTVLSLASSLNMSYLDDLNRAAGTDTDDWEPACRRLQDYRVERFLKARGYRYIHIGPFFQPTMNNPNADENFSSDPARLEGSPFVASLLSNPTLPPGSREEWTRRNGLRHWISVQYQFHQLPAVAREKGPKFVFAHILLPHGPYVFDRNGDYLPASAVAGRSSRENYLEHLRYANTQMKRLIDDLLGRPGARPVILLQSDEGPFPARYLLNQMGFDWHTATPAELRMKTGILNAYLLPAEGGKPSLYPEVSPVNSFRLVFNALFKAGLPLLPDRVYAFRSGKHLYDFFDVTEKVRPTAARSGPAQRTNL